jgi:hypothetical protein
MVRMVIAHIIIYLLMAICLAGAIFFLFIFPIIIFNRF